MHFLGLCCVVTYLVVLRLTPLRKKVCPLLEVHILNIFTYTTKFLSKVHVRVFFKINSSNVHLVFFFIILT